MYTDAVNALAEQAGAKLTHQRLSLGGHLIRSILAGMYVGVAIALIFTIGGLLSTAAPGTERIVMGICFGGALTIVVFAGSELFTGSNLVLTLGVLCGKASMRDLGANWVWTWIGNLLGSVLLAVLVVYSGVMEPVKPFVLKLTNLKMNIPADQLVIRAILANWIVCLGVWMAVRIKSETARILMIWWCMFTFITCAFEHSIANMCGLMMGFIMNQGSIPGITFEGYWYNLSLATLGNIIGGAFFVAGMYWMGSPKARQSHLPMEESVLPGSNGVTTSKGLVGEQSLEHVSK
jgi:nitrite transporter NirC